MSKYMTRQRRVLLGYLSRHADELLSAQEVGEALKDENISLSSVYRNLAELEAEGQLRRGSRGNQREVFYQYIGADACRGCLHLSCQKCGRTFHMHTGGMERLLSVVADTEGFSVDKSETVLYGVCRSCQATGQESQASGEKGETSHGADHL